MFVSIDSIELLRVHRFCVHARKIRKSITRTPNIVTHEIIHVLFVYHLKVNCEFREN